MDGPRFSIRSRDGVQPLRDQHFEKGSPELVLSLALTRACKPEALPGTWTVLEYGDPVYYVERHEADKAPQLVTIWQA